MLYFGEQLCTLLIYFDLSKIQSFMSLAFFIPRIGKNGMKSYEHCSTGP